MKKDQAVQDYEFSYTDKDLFEHEPWCPLFGELPTIFGNHKKHQIADRCVDIILTARNLWEIPYPYSSGGTILSSEHLALSNPNWPDFLEIPGYEAAILAARSIAWWNHYHIVTNARDYCRHLQVPYPYHWYENDAGILHYTRQMHHFSQPSGTGIEHCPLLRYPPGSFEEAALIKYEHNIAVQNEARQVPDYLVFAALAIAEAWQILSEILYYGQRERAADIQYDLAVAEKFLEKAHKIKIDSDKRILSEKGKDLETLMEYVEVIQPDAEIGKRRRQQQAAFRENVLPQSEMDYGAG